MREPTRRLVAAGGLLALLLAMTLHYGAVDARHDQSDAGRRAIVAYDRHVGETVYFWGRVVSADGDSMVVSAGDRTLLVRWEGEAPPGAAVQVYGRLEPGGVVTAERVVVSPAAGLRYLYAVSVVGLAVAAVGFLREWRFDRDRLAFVPREGDDA